ncbi:hypothetical protein BaRGS_00030809 [Batillaria attramentaria]|uniref:Uncharacterized protein n=1 Tax=Batillaria attramentaria TaxID=370345 RepID=A0ABD0JSB4_9CAEN
MSRARSPRAKLAPTLPGPQSLTHRSLSMGNSAADILNNLCQSAPIVLGMKRSSVDNPHGNGPNERR